MDFKGFDCLKELRILEINPYSFDHGFALQDMSSIGSAELYENLSGQTSSYSDPKTVESQTDQSPPISACSGDIATNHQNGKLWMDMDENSGLLEWEDNDAEIAGSKRATKTCKSDGSVLQWQQERPASKNLQTERKRRKKMKETLYKLRSVVPNISKMDKQSILGDAISYVLDLQKKVQDIEVEIQAMTRSNRPDHTQLITTETTIKPLTDANSALINSAHMKQSAEKLISRGKIFEIDICDIGERGVYHVRIEMKKEAVGLVQLMRALESLSLHIMNSNICRFDDAIICTLTLNENSMQTVGVDKLEVLIRQTIANASLV